MLPNERSPNFLTFIGYYSGKAPAVTLMWPARDRWRNVVGSAERVRGLRCGVKFGLENLKKRRLFGTPGRLILGWKLKK